jgi:ribokinase
MCDQLARAGVDVGGVRVLADMPTGTAYIAVDAQGENQIIVSSGADRGLEVVDPVMEGVLLAQLEVPVAVLAPLLARSAAIRILNAAPPVPEAAALFDHLDIVIVNQHELATFLMLPAVPDTVEQALSARTLLIRPEQIVIVTMGAGGVIAIWQDRHLHVPAVPVMPVDTVGAGDCFCGTLAALLDEGSRIEDALHLANAAAALCTLGQGAAPSMPDRAAAEAFLAKAATEHAPENKTVVGARLN